MSDKPAARQVTGLVEPSEEEYRLFRDLVKDTSGINLGPSKKALLHGRLAGRLRELGLPSFAAYYRRVVGDRGGDELREMLDRITTNETHFFREPHHFEDLHRSVLPAWAADAERGRRSRHVRVWSAGCSTGEEPYSLAMVLLSHFPAERGFSVEILATDLSTRVLARAREATWPIAKAEEIPRPFLHRFMLKGIGSRAGTLRAGPEIRAAIDFSRLNLNDPEYPSLGRFDLIFCRNVLIYFEPKDRQRIVELLAARLTPEGRLYLGHAESVREVPGKLRSLGATTYVRLPPSIDQSQTKETGTCNGT
jgi:chemotaxis protein methyltransferase CheR